MVLTGPNPGGGRTGLKVLAIEDDRDLLFFYERALREAGHEVVVAGDGEAGLVSVFSEDPDVILLDLSLPLLDGQQLLRELLAAKPPPAARVVVVTGRDPRDDTPLEGVAAMIQKPFAIETLLQAISGEPDGPPTVPGVFRVGEAP